MSSAESTAALAPGLPDVPLAIVDVETTGFSPERGDRVIELAVLRQSPDGALAEYTTLVNPERDVGPTHVHGVRDADVRDAPRFADVAADVARLLDGAVLVAHNLRFDRAFLTAELGAAGQAPPALPGLCTLALAYRLHPEFRSRKLSHCCAQAGIEHNGRHSALGDAQATLKLLHSYLDEVGRRGLLDLAALGCAPLPPPRGWARGTPSGRALVRPARLARTRPARALERLIERAPGTDAGSAVEAEYLNLLERALADRLLTPDERAALADTAARWGLGAEHVRALHRDHVRALARAARADGVTTDDELQDIEKVRALLDVPREAVDGVLQPQDLAASRPGDGPPVSARRQAAVERARQGWITRLVDLSRRNNLLYFRPLKRGTLEVTQARPEPMANLLRGVSVPLTALLGEADEAQAARVSLRSIQRQALANLEERGLATLFLAMGLATWQVDDDGRPPASPLLLVPLRVEGRGRDGAAQYLQRAGDLQVNPVLLQVLADQRRIALEPGALIELLEGDDPGETFDLEPTFARVRSACADVPGFGLAARLVLGNFSFQKMAIVRDLRELGPALARHDVIAALAGDAEARLAIQGRRAPSEPPALDRTPPEREFQVLDADASQQRAIAAALRGQDGVIQGPPGTGKSQTIANLIAELVAQGRRVLFVAEKRAALEVVIERLRAVQLDHLTLDLHGAEVTRRDVMRQFAESLEAVAGSLPVDAGAVARGFAAQRATLVEHVERLHAPRAPADASVFELAGRLLGLDHVAEVDVRWRGADLDRLDDAAGAEVERLLGLAADHADLFLRRAPTPWVLADVRDGAAAQAAADRAAWLAREGWPDLRRACQRLCADTGQPPARDAAEAERRLALVDEANALLALYDDALWTVDAGALARALGPARAPLSRLWAFLTDSSFRDARRRLLALRRAGRAGAAHLLDEVARAARLRAAWEAEAPGPPRGSDAARELRSVLDRVRAEQRRLLDVVGRADAASPSFDEAERLARALAADRLTPYQLPELRERERQLADLGLQPFVDELRRRQSDPSTWIDQYRRAWLASCLERALAGERALAAFHGRGHDRTVDEFCRLDRERLKHNAARVRYAHALHAVDSMNAHPEQAALVRREARKKARHLPLRQFVAQAGDVLTALRPCWLASPLSVSQLLPAQGRRFDVVLFDEASQVLPEDAVATLLRAERAIVAGDRHQLPPTTFFASAADDGEPDDAAPAEGFESLLDLFSSLVDPWTLDWHYRSRDEALIAFSNRHVYGDRLVTLPSAWQGPALTHVLVAPDASAHEDGSTAEAQRVVELVLEHARLRPDESLGVIAMGVAHAGRIQAALDQTLDGRSDLDAFFDPARHERFFVKNLERVQGDERDAVILSIGYGTRRDGRLVHTFGPLASKGGERRLNVAVTRARNRLTLVSSFTHADMDPARSRADGVRLLREYLAFAGGGWRGAGPGRADDSDRPFEQHVWRALTDAGIPLTPRVGASRQSIDLAARHPSRPERFVLAVECDGATYRRFGTARDRDRLRRAQLEKLGWRHHRIWALDWWLRRDLEVTRAVAAYEQAVAAADEADARAASGDGPATEAVPAPPEPAPGPAVAPSRVGPRPVAPRPGAKIHDYSNAEIDATVRWLASDGRPRADDELLALVLVELGFERRGKRIVDALRAAIDRTRPTRPR